MTSDLHHHSKFGDGKSSYRDAKVTPCIVYLGIVYSNESSWNAAIIEAVKRSEGSLSKSSTAVWHTAATRGRALKATMDVQQQDDGF